MLDIGEASRETVATSQENADKSSTDAFHAACRLRFGPILMTTIFAQERGIALGEQLSGLTMQELRSGTGTIFSLLTSQSDA